MFPRKFTEHPNFGFGCLVGTVFVPLAETDWIVCSNTFPDRFQVFSDKQFNNQFQKPEDIEIIC